MCGYVDNGELFRVQNTIGAKVFSLADGPLDSDGEVRVFDSEDEPNGYINVQAIARLRDRLTDLLGDGPAATETFGPGDRVSFTVRDSDGEDYTEEVTGTVLGESANDSGAFLVKRDDGTLGGPEYADEGWYVHGRALTLVERAPELPAGEREKLSGGFTRGQRVQVTDGDGFTGQAEFLMEEHGEYLVRRLDGGGWTGEAGAHLWYVPQSTVTALPTVEGFAVGDQVLSAYAPPDMETPARGIVMTLDPTGYVGVSFPGASWGLSINGEVADRSGWWVSPKNLTKAPAEEPEPEVTDEPDPVAAALATLGASVTALAEALGK